MTLPIALIAIFLINSFDPYNEMLSAVRLVGNYIEVGEEVSVSTKQTCPVGIWNTSTHLLEENPNCTASRELLKMPRVETKKKITLLLLYYNDHKHLAHRWFHGRTLVKPQLIRPSLSLWMMEVP